MKEILAENIIEERKEGTEVLETMLETQSMGRKD